MLDVQGATVKYGDLVAVEEVSLSADRGGVVGVLGPNGAGKTTLLRAIAGSLPLYAGEISLNERPITSLSCDQRVRAGIALVPQGRLPIVGMSVRENLLLPAVALKRTKADRLRLLDEIYTLFPRLRERERQLAGVLSGGEQQMLAIGRALMTKAEVLMLDEPMAGLAPIVGEEIYAVTKQLADAGDTAIILVDQAIEYVMEIATTVYVLNNGRMVASGPTADFSRDRLQSLYMN